MYIFLIIFFMYVIDQRRKNSTKMDDLKINLVTWNVFEAAPLNDGFLGSLFNVNPTDDLYVISLQEIPTGVLETVYSIFFYDDWVVRMQEFFGQKDYFMVENIRLQGMSLTVFASYKHLPHIHFVKYGFKRTGFGGLWGNKGGVAISCTVYGKTICFLNCHLAPHLQYNDARVQHFNSIASQLEFDENSTVLSHDILFLAGDLNFRIEDMSIELINDLIQHNRFDELIKNDQLYRQYRSNVLLKEFKEEHVTFPPTYKFVVGTSTYDSSKRLPAWTDRILCRINPELLSGSNATDTKSSSSYKHNYCKSTNVIKPVTGSYRCRMEFQQSDHKPVTAIYQMNITETFYPLVELKTARPWLDVTPPQVTVSYFNQYSSDGYDYLALYEKNFCDPRSYKLWIYIPVMEDSDPVQITFPAFSIAEDGDYRVGYYSHKMSCLLAMSKPFTIFKSSPVQNF